MELNFKEFLSLIEVSNRIGVEDSQGHNRDVVFDQADVDYLNQFPSHFQAKALEARYGSLLCRSLEKTGERTNSSWSDLQTINFKSRSFTIDTGITALVERLKKLGFDLSQQCLLEKPFKIETAAIILNKWRRLSGGKDLKPNVTGFRGHWSKTIDKAGEEGYANTKSDLYDYVEEKVTQILQYYSNPDISLHINYYYWKESINKLHLINLTMQYLKKKHEEPSLDRPVTTQKGLNYWTRGFIARQFERGYVTKSRIRSAVKQGLNIPELFKQGKTLHEIIQSIKYGALDVRKGRPASWKFRNVLKSQGLDPAPKSKFALYGKNLSNLGRKQGRPEVPWMSEVPPARKRGRPEIPWNLSIAETKVP